MNARCLQIPLHHSENSAPTGRTAAPRSSTCRAHRLRVPVSQGAIAKHLRPVGRGIRKASPHENGYKWIGSNRFFQQVRSVRCERCDAYLQYRSQKTKPDDYQRPHHRLCLQRKVVLSSWSHRLPQASARPPSELKGHPQKRFVYRQHHHHRCPRDEPPDRKEAHPV